MLLYMFGRVVHVFRVVHLDSMVHVWYCVTCLRLRQLFGTVVHVRFCSMHVGYGTRSVVHVWHCHGGTFFAL